MVFNTNSSFTYQLNTVNDYSKSKQGILVFMARRAIPMIAFPWVRTIYIYLYVCVTYASMRCIRS